MRSPVKRIHFLEIFKTDAFQQVLSGLGGLADAPQDQARFGIQQTQINIILRKKTFDELLVALTQQISFLIRQAREATAQGLPEFDTTFFGQWRSQFTQNPVFKTFGMKRYI